MANKKHIRLIAFAALIVIAMAACAAPAPAPTPARQPSATGPGPALPEATPGAPPDATATEIAPPPTQTLVPTTVPAARQLTSGGCCVQPFWSPDGLQVWFVDRPDASRPAGLWGVDAVAGGEPQFITDRLGIFSADRRLIAYPEGGQTYVEQLGGARWTVPSNGRAITFSADGSRIAWQQAPDSGNFDQRSVEVWLANVDGSQARPVARLFGGGLSGWLPGGDRLLVSGRESLETEPFLAALDAVTGELSLIAQGNRLRGAVASPDGGWVAYMVTFSGDPARDGLWIARTDGTDAVRLQVFGAYRWRAEGRLLVVPLEMGTGSQRLVEVEAASGALRALTDPGLTPMRIANGDWALSPDGSRVAFVSSDDHNIWILDLP